MGQFENPGVPPDYIGMWTGEGSDGPLTGIVTEEVGGWVLQSLPVTHSSDGSSTHSANARL